MYTYIPAGTHIYVKTPGIEVIVEYGMPHEPLRVDGKATQYQGSDVVRRARRTGASETATAIRMALEIADPEIDWSSLEDVYWETRPGAIARHIPADASKIGEVRLASERVRRHIAAAVAAAHRGDAATMADELQEASDAELCDHDDDPITQAACAALLGEGWVVDDGILLYEGS